MIIPNANLIIQDKNKRQFKNSIPQGLRIQYTTFDKVLESQTQKSTENRSNQLIESQATTQYNDLIQSAAEKYGVDSSLIKSIIKAESDLILQLLLMQALKVLCNLCLILLNS